jgi:phage baseplate assembly protein gpV
MSSRNERILAEMVRIGKVADVDAEKQRARVLFEDRGDIMSDYLPILTITGSVYIPEINDKVLCIYEATLDKGIGQGLIIGTFGKYPSEGGGDDE